jgi:hypothetical protein
VGDVRRSLCSEQSEKPAERTYTTKHGTEAVMKTEKIGKAKPAEAPAPKEAAVNEPMPVKREVEDTPYYGPSAEELAEAETSAREDISAMLELAQSDDKLGTALAENEKLRLQLAVTETTRDGYMNRCNELIARVTSLKRQIKKLEGGQHLKLTMCAV